MELDEYKGLIIEAIEKHFENLKGQRQRLRPHPFILSPSIDQIKLFINTINIHSNSKSLDNNNNYNQMNNNHNPPSNLALRMLNSSSNPSNPSNPSSPSSPSNNDNNDNNIAIECSWDSIPFSPSLSYVLERAVYDLSDKLKVKSEESDNVCSSLLSDYKVIYRGPKNNFQFFQDHLNLVHPKTKPSDHSNNNYNNRNRPYNIHDNTQDSHPLHFNQNKNKLNQNDEESNLYYNRYLRSGRLIKGALYSFRVKAVTRHFVTEWSESKLIVIPNNNNSEYSNDHEGSFLGDSCIINNKVNDSNNNYWDNIKWFYLWFERFKIPRGSRLLYRGSLHGFDSRAFHLACDNKGPTISIIQSSNNNIFGGFTLIPWSQGKVHGPQPEPHGPRPNTHGSEAIASASSPLFISSNKADRESFLFSLKNVYSTPLIFPISPEEVNNAVCHDGNVGPAFGAGRDLLIWTNSNQNYVSYSNPKSFSNSTLLALNEHKNNNPLGITLDSDLFAGSKYFQVKEMEVFEISF